MNIKRIADKIIEEADIEAHNYSVSRRIEDINAEYLMRVEKAMQIGSTVPISNAEDTTEEFVVVAGSNTFTRTIKDVPIQRVDFIPTGGSYHEPVTLDPSRLINGISLADQKYFANEKQFFVENGYPGTLRVTYARGGITLFTVDDYNLGDASPSPDWLPETFHPLLWLPLALTQSQYYEKDRTTALETKLERVETLFENHYGRDAQQVSEFFVDDGRDSCFGRPSHR